LFVADRNTLAIQTEDAFTEHLPHLPCYRVPRVGRRFQDEKRVTIVTLQTLVNEYENYSSGYFDLVVIDECHRSIYGKWRRALDHFDGIKIGLTATPCVMQDAPDVDEEGATGRGGVTDWPQVKLGELIVEAAYGTSVKCSDTAEGTPVLRMGNVRYDGTLDLH
jgi:hypothetical protein